MSSAAPLSSLSKLSEKVLDAVEGGNSRPDPERGVYLLWIYAKAKRITVEQARAVINTMGVSNNVTEQFYKHIFQKDMKIYSNSPPGGSYKWWSTIERDDRLVYFVKEKQDEYFQRTHLSEASILQKLFLLLVSWRRSTEDPIPPAELNYKHWIMDINFRDFVAFEAEIRRQVGNPKGYPRLFYTLPPALVKEIQSVKVEESLSHVHPNYVPAQRTLRFLRVLN